MHLLGRSRAEKGTVVLSSQSPTLTLTLIKRDVVVPSSPHSPLVPAVFGMGPVGLPAPNHTLSLFLRPCKHRACYSWSNPGSHTLRTHVHRCIHRPRPRTQTHPHSHFYTCKFTFSAGKMHNLFPFFLFSHILWIRNKLNSWTRHSRTTSSPSVPKYLQRVTTFLHVGSLWGGCSTRSPCECEQCVYIYLCEQITVWVRLDIS